MVSGSDWWKGMTGDFRTEEQKAKEATWWFGFFSAILGGGGALAFFKLVMHLNVSVQWIP